MRVGELLINALREVRKIYSSINADEIRSLARQDVSIGLIAASESAYRDMEEFLTPAAGALANLHRLNGTPANEHDFTLVQPGLPVPPNGYEFPLIGRSLALEKIVADHQSKELAIACAFPGFRRAVADRIIHRISGENALCSLVTALPNVIPSMLDLPWAFGEFATDTAFLTMNQIRMALLLAAAHNRTVGYREQKMEIAAIAGGAFGWRALARELVGKIPLGGGLIPKAAVAFAGTYVVGIGLEKINRNGEGLSRWERREAYADALGRGREVARSLVASVYKKE